MSDFEQLESSKRQHHQDLEHQEKMNLIIEQEEYNLFALLKPKIYKDGDQWCVLLGEDIQVGIAGFGDTPYRAVLDWNKQWYSTPNQKQ